MDRAHLTVNFPSSNDSSHQEFKSWNSINLRTYNNAIIQSLNYTARFDYQISRVEKSNAIKKKVLSILR